MPLGSEKSLNCLQNKILTLFTIWFLGVFTCFVLPKPAFAETFGLSIEDYQKEVFMIPMRDGIKLYTVVYSPKNTKMGKFPVLINRTPYGVGPYEEGKKKTALGPSNYLMEDGYIFVYQDVRGKMMSEGEFVEMRPYIANKTSKKQIDEATDAYDTVEWLTKNLKNHNGNFGFWGISYPGYYASMALLDAHKNVKAVSPQAPVTDWFIGDDFHRNGAFWLPHFFSFETWFGVPRPNPTPNYAPNYNFGTRDGYNFYLKNGSLAELDAKTVKGSIPFIQEFMNHPVYDAWWQARNTRQFFNNVKPASLVVGGWFDAENCFGALELYKTIEQKNPKNKNYLCMGPWYHGQWARDSGRTLGDIDFQSATADFYRREIEYPFFTYYLKEKGILTMPEAWVFETGTNQWKTSMQFPPSQGTDKSLYLAPSGKIEWDKAPIASGFTEYIADPERPVPYTRDFSIGMVKDYMVEDQRFAATRPDVAIFESEPFREEVTFSGPLDVEFFLSTTGTDADYIVKVIDVFPDSAKGFAVQNKKVPMGGYQMLLRGDAFRAKFRNSMERPEPLVPNEVTRLKFSLNACNHTFKKGHKLMIQVQSHWFPLVDRNPQVFTDIYRAQKSDYKKASHKIHFGGNNTSKISWKAIRFNP